MNSDATFVTHLAKQLGAALLSRGWRVSCAESCTGGGVAKAITDVAGSSQWFDGGVVTYSNAMKQQLLGVAEESFAEHGAVSETVVMQMAQGALQVTGADVAVASSGIAGPGGGCADKPVGTVWLAWVCNDKRQVVHRYHFDGDRETVRQRAVVQALSGLLEFLLHDE